MVLGGDLFFLKVSRRLDEGTSTDLEVGRFLVERGASATVAPLAGFLEYRPDRGEPTTLAVLRRFTANEGDAFSRAVEEVGIPQTVRETILLRIGRLDDTHVDVLRAAAVLGRSFTYDALLELADADEETVQLARKAGGEASALAADVGEEAAVIDYVARCIKSYGGLEVVFANAGISGGWTPLFEQTVDYWTEILRVNLIGPFLTLKHAGAHMARQGKGSIILTASVAALRANAGGNAYAASKAGLIRHG